MNKAQSGWMNAGLYLVLRSSAHLTCHHAAFSAVWRLPITPQKFLQPRIGISKNTRASSCLPTAQINPSTRGIPDDDAPEIGVCHCP